MDGEYTYSPFHHTFLEREMFTTSKYIEFKRKGKFYEVAYEDAYILWYLLRYKIYNNKVGFPESSLFTFSWISKKRKMEISKKIKRKAFLFLNHEKSIESMYSSWQCFYYGFI